MSIHVGRKPKRARKIRVVKGRVKWSRDTPIHVGRLQRIILSNPELSDDEKQRILERRAKERWGTTENARKAGYILSDGSMIDMSQGKPTRSVHHMAVYGLYKDDEGNKDIPLRSQEGSVENFLKDTGAIRMHASPSLGGVSLEFNTQKRPTEVQWQTIEREYKEMERRPGETWIAYDVYDPKGSRVAAKYLENFKGKDVDWLRGEVERFV